MNVLLITFASSLLFGTGLIVSGMTLPEKVVGFLSVTDKWDPSLALVMVGAIAVHALLYRLILRRPSPLFAKRFSIPTRRDLDGRLVAGAAIFGVGWGLGGVCPGPGVVATMSGAVPMVQFTVGMVGGMILFRLWDNLPAKNHATAKVTPS